ncbi:MAG: hypothetical protein NTW28_08175, partial [Candidatus Solibacter sp.]|nr:hypothetical protein [Candidatus Solibacter sp.]
MEHGLYNAWNTKFESVHDPVFVRAIVVDNGLSALAIVSIDAVGNDVASEMLQAITEATGIVARNVILVSTHDHNGPRISRAPPRARNNNPAPPPAPGADAWTRKVIAAVADAVRQAKAGLQPALMGFGKGAVDIN